MQNIEQFKYFLLRAGKSKSTIVKDLDILNRVSKLIPLEKYAVEQYIFTLYQEGRSPAYLNNIIIAMREWGKFTNDTTFNEIKYFKLKETNKSTLSDSEIEAFLAVPKPKQSKPDRYRMYTLFFKVMAFSGMRAGEVAALTIQQIDFGRNIFILDKTKTTPRLVPIAQTLIPELTEYIKTLQGQQLFTINGKILDKNKWNEHFQIRVRLLGIKRPRLSTHSLRHSFITRMLSEDVNIFKVQRIVGHRNIETTNHYTHLVTKDLTVALEKDPLAKQALSFLVRHRMFKEELTKLVEKFAQTLEEEEVFFAEIEKREKAIKITTN